RFDVYMAPFYRRDTAFGILTEERAKELIECLYIKATELISLRPNDYSRDFAGYPLWQILMIGGVDGRGRDVTNPVSYLVLDAAA
ncbi:MAG TPA: pyruvate formate-lyase, partial [Ruminococcaceae bacterium]|nr:pyruvate formate-lyase [Oscillospiraceae bacterium]